MRLLFFALRPDLNKHRGDLPFKLISYLRTSAAPMNGHTGETSTAISNGAVTGVRRVYLHDYIRAEDAARLETHLPVRALKLPDINSNLN